MSNLTIRIISAIVMILGGFAALLLNLESRWFIIAVITVVGAWELSRLVDRKFTSQNLSWFSMISALAFSLPYFPGIVFPLYWIWMVCIVSLVVNLLMGFKFLDIEVMAPWILMKAAVCIYMGLWATRLFALTNSQLGWAGIGPLAFTITVVAAEDTGAYAAGRTLGKHKLAPHISEKKTIEGTIGGTLAGMIVAGILGPKLVGINVLPAVLLGAVLALAAAAGDLFISVIKRYAGAKDTSNLIPGHGGIMDRFDALVFVAPMAWLGLKLLAG